jgi:hypothetical protein
MLVCARNDAKRYQEAELLQWDYREMRKRREVRRVRDYRRMRGCKGMWLIHVILSYSAVALS